MTEKTENRVSNEIAEIAIARKREFKPGRVDGKNSKHKSSGRIPQNCKKEIEVILKENRDKGAVRDKKVGNETQEKRSTVIRGFFADLFLLGHKIQSVHSLKQKHLIAVFNYQEEMNQSPSTIQNKISIMRTFCEWLGKNGMVRESSNYVKNKASVRRSTVVQEDKSWAGKGIDVAAKIAEVAAEDYKISLRLELCFAFGLRVTEAMSLKPAVATVGSLFGAAVHVRDGTKGGRSRLVPIENQVQLDVIKRAIAASDKTTGFLNSKGTDLEKQRQHFYYIMRKCNITLASDGISAHGLRHQYMHESHKRLSGIEPPVKGGDLSQIDKDEYRIMSMQLMERAGHSRVSIGSAYYGSRRVKKTKPDPEK